MGILFGEVVVSIQQHAIEAVAGRPELTIAGSPAFKEKLHKTALVQKIVEIGLQSQLVGHITFKTSADKKTAAPAKNFPDGKDVEINSTGDIQRSLETSIKNVVHRQIVGVRLVVGDQNHAVFFKQVKIELGIVQMNIVIEFEQSLVQEFNHHADPIGGKIRRHLGQVFENFFLLLGRGLPRLQPLYKFRITQDDFLLAGERLHAMKQARGLDREGGTRPFPLESPP